MQIKVEQFCSLATSPAWQAWLYRYNADLYKSFIDRLQKSKNCSSNRIIMKDLLHEIEQLGGAQPLQQFLEQQYPHVIVTSVAPDKIVDKYQVFKDFGHGIITYPHRQIFEGKHAELEQKIKQFLARKGVSDYIIIDDIGYVEYLEVSEGILSDKIPEKNWLIKTYRKNTI